MATDEEIRARDGWTCRVMVEVWFPKEAGPRIPREHGLSGSEIDVVDGRAMCPHCRRRLRDGECEPLRTPVLRPSVLTLEGEQATAEASRFHATEDWPKWPVVPVKRSTAEGDGPMLGTVFARDIEEGRAVRVFARDVFAFSQEAMVVLARNADRNPYPRYGVYRDVEAMIAHGWRGD